MSTKRPELRDFGITLEEYNLYYGSSELARRVGRGVVLAAVSIAFAVGVLTQGMGFAFGLAFFGLLASGLVALFVAPRIVRFQRSRLLRSDVASRIERYLEAETAYEEAERARQGAEIRRLEPEGSRREAERKRQFGTPDGTGDPGLRRQPTQQQTTHPTCPMPGCAKEMILRTGRYGKSWECSAYPTCRGTRLV